MKKTLKLVLVIFILITLLSGNIAVLAKETVDEITNEESSASGETSVPEDSSEKNKTSEPEEIEENGDTNEPTDDPTEETQDGNQDFTDETRGEADTPEETDTLEESGQPAAIALESQSQEISNQLPSAKGELNLTIDLRLPQKKIKASNLKVSLKKSGLYETEEPKEATGEEKEKELFYTFPELTAGTYALTIEGKDIGYQTFSQDIEIKENTISEVYLTNGYDGLAVEKVKTGVLAVGDVNKDGNINKNDVTSIINHIEGKSNLEEDNSEHNVYDYVYDLNQDGNIDIVDISYAALNMGHSFEGANPRFITNLNIDNVETKIQGTVQKDEQGRTPDVKDVLLGNNDEHITVAPPNASAPISKDNQVSIEIDIPQEDNATTQLLNIAPSNNVENNITKGTIIAEGYDNSTKQNVKVECEITTADENSNKSAEIKSIYKLAENPVAVIDSVNVVSKKGTAVIQKDGSITVNFGDAIAVKKVVINVKGTNTNKLADVSKVEFLNGMEDKIPEPNLNIPTLRTKDIDNSITEEGYTIKWNNEPNVTGYHVLITATIGGKQQSEEFDVDGHELKIKQFNGKDIKDLLDKGKVNGSSYTVYQVRVRSVNGSWHSPYCDPYSVEPRPTSKPNAPTGVTLKGGYQSIKVTWNADPRATSYIVEYKETDGNGDYKQAHKVETRVNKVTGKNETVGIEQTSYTITGLSSGIKQYSVRVKACNSVGVSDPSQSATAKTLAVQKVELPTYKKINISKGEGVLSDHIKNITYNQASNRTMYDSPLDMQNGSLIKNSAKGIADNSFSSYFGMDDWDFGGFYMGSDKGMIVEFDKAYKMNYITLAKVEWNGDFGYARVWYNDCSEGSTKGKQLRADASQVVTRTDAEGNRYTAIKLQKPIYTNKMVVSFGNASTGNRRITIAEMGFYEYDDIEERINNLFKDAMHLELKDNISTEEGKNAVLKKIEALENELNNGIQKVGGAQGEKDYHPDKEALLNELQTARLLLNNVSLGKITKINSRITDYYDSHIEFKGSLNGFQPLGVSARAGQEITIYVGNPYMNVGDNTRLQLIGTQWRAEGGFKQVLIKELQVGINKVTIPEMIDTDREKGGSLYINYTGLKDDDPFRYMDRNFAVRVIGGEELPVLDLTTKENTETGAPIAMTKEERDTAILKYVQEIKTIVGTLEEKHNGEACKDYRGKENQYGVQDCLLGLTEIVLDPMMYSVSSKQIYDGLIEKLGKSDPTDQELATALDESLEAMEEMMDLFYHQKGLVKEGESQNTDMYGDKNTYPRTRQNIRCMRMTGRAFMYAGSEHIGIQWNEVKDLSKGVPMDVDLMGKETESSKGNYFGWGIAHEIGHVINQQAYVHGEVTNNYFSILAQTDNTRKTVRFSYEDVYKKVTSGKTGKAQNVFTQLGLYWQLHLAYDLGGYNYKDFGNQTNQFDNSIYARMDTYARNPSKAPTPTNNNNVPLNINSDSDNNLMRLACAATKKNILEFFEKWGMVPNSETRSYAEQWPKETRAIWYVNDESRNYVIEKGKKLTDSGANLQASITNAQNNRVANNKVNISLNITEADANGLLGYEIIRSYRSNDTEISRAVAFVEPKTDESGKVTSASVNYLDTIDTINNRAFTYTVVAYDKYLNEIGRQTLEPVKVSHSGQISQDGWEVTTNIESDKDEVLHQTKPEDQNIMTDKTAETSDFDQVISNVPVIADGKEETVFKGTTKEGKAEITISLPEIKKLVGLEYSGKKLDGYEIQVSNNGKDDWKTVKKVEKPGAIARAYTAVKNFFTNMVSTEDVTMVTDEVISFVQILNDEQTINSYDYDCSYVKLIIDDTNVEISEIDLLAQSGDNVEYLEGASIGKLESDYEYAKDQSIPKDSIIFMGTYKGNPAYNVVKLWYEDETTKGWKMLSGYQIILAPDPGKADLGEIEEGQWVYVLEKQEIGLDGEYTGKENEDYKLVEDALGKGKVRVELYRVDNAKTNDGERLVSDTLIKTTPKTLDKINIETDSN